MGITRRDFLAATAAVAVQPKGFMIEKGSAHITKLRLKTAEPLKLEAFYRDKLGARILRSSPTELAVSIGETELAFEKGEGKPYYHVAFNIPENKLEEAKTWLSARTPLMNEGRIYHFESWDAHAFYFMDPAGNILELIARHTLKNASSRAFSAKDLLCASEIGVVTPDVLGAVRWGEQELGLKQYRPASAEFATLGDENGLLIVVKEGRKWFGTESGAEVHTTEVGWRGVANEVRHPAAKLVVR